MAAIISRSVKPLLAVNRSMIAELRNQNGKLVDGWRNDGLCWKFRCGVGESDARNRNILFVDEWFGRVAAKIQKLKIDFTSA